MARIDTIQTNFTSGEISPRAKGRVDIARYANALEILYNFVAFTIGGIARRAGLHFNREVDDSTKLHRLIPFVYSRAQAYMLVLGHQTMWVGKDEGIVESSPGVPYALAIPYLSTELAAIKFRGIGNTMYLWHPSYFPRILTRNAHADWKITLAPFTVEPSAEQGIKPAATLTLGAVSGTGVTATASVAVFLASDVGRSITSGNGNGKITAIGGGGTTATINIVDAFASVGPIASQAWTLTISPATTLTPSAAGLGAAVTLTLAADGWRAGDVGSYVLVNDGLVEITAYTSALIVDGLVRSVLTNTVAASSGAWTLEQKVWTAALGYPRCGTIFEQRLYSAGSLTYPQTIWGSKVGELLNMAIGADDDDAVNFTISSEDISEIEHLASESDLIPLTYGGESRMYGGSDSTIAPTNVRIKSQSVWGCSTVRPVRVGNEIVYVARSGKKIRAAKFSFESDKFVSPNITLLAEHITKTPGARKGGPGIIDLCYQQDPDPLLWAVRADGFFLPCSYDREQEVVAWSRCETIGVVESMAVIPYDGEDQVWSITRRLIGGVWKRFIEFLDPEINTDAAVSGAVPDHVPAVGEVAAAGSDPQWYIQVNHVAHGHVTGDRVKLQGFLPATFNVARSIEVINANFWRIRVDANPGAVTTIGVVRYGAATWGGVGHLLGETVDVVADGVNMPTQVVAGANITLTRQAFDVEFGLHYSSLAKLLPIESQSFGTTQGKTMSVYEVIVRVHETRGLWVDGREVAFTQHGVDVHDNPAVLFSGDKTIERLIWEKSGGAITLEQRLPLPATVLAVIRKVNIER